MGSSPIFGTIYVPLAQLVEHLTFNQGVRDSSSLRDTTCLGGGIGRHVGLKIPCPLKACRFDSGPRYHLYIFIGAIAQLGERLFCTQEVSGSIPLSSTNKNFNDVEMAL